MGTPKQSLAMGQLQSLFQHEFQFYLSQQVVTRLWNKDISLWPPEVVEDDPALAKLDWVSLPETISHFLAQLKSRFYQGLCLSEYDTLVHWRRPVLRLHLSREFPAALDPIAPRLWSSPASIPLLT